ELTSEGRRIGVAGEVHPAVLADLGLPGRAVAAEVWFDHLTEGGRTPQAQALPRFPGVRRDLTVVLHGKAAGNDLVQVIRQLGGYTLREVSMLGEYTGPQLGPDARSLSFRLAYQAGDRTLTNANTSQYIATTFGITSAMWAHVVTYTVIVTAAILLFEVLGAVYQRYLDMLVAPVFDRLTGTLAGAVVGAFEITVTLIVGVG